ncbi:MAG: sporulation related protein [Deltaproteobacteria bacterium]|nr:sporulation related protein [Deltaproteobacteria bacterium]
MGEPVITVGIADMQPSVTGRLNGNFLIEGAGLLSGPFHASADGTGILLFDERNRLVAHSRSVRLAAHEGSTFRISDVTIGIRFHWERKEDQVFQGNLILTAREADNIAIVNEISLEDYLVSVISSEMSGTAPHEFLKVHSIISRSWLLAALDRKNVTKAPVKPAETEELIRWYNREDHDIFDVCADDHCQRYQGVTKIISGVAADAVAKTRGYVLAYGDKVCDARYFKACGGITENYETAWEETPVPYLVSISDSQSVLDPVVSEDKAADWVLGSPDVYCNTKDEELLAEILPGFDRETTQFFRWKMEYSRRQLENIIRQKSGIDFGTLHDLTPLERGPSGRIKRLKITGSKQSIVIGKELEIRRWLSPTHLYSSAFIVSVKKGPDGLPDGFILNGAGWGHGVGLCQIGAAVMAKKGFTAEEILAHYFTGADIKKIY